MNYNNSNWPVYKLSDPKVCTLNPRKSEISSLPDETLVSFVPMAKVDDVSGLMDASFVRKIGEVRKGYTYFAEGDVVFAKITPCMENGKSAVARNLHNGIGFGTTEFHVLRPGPLVIPEWLHFFVRRDDFRQAAKKSMQGAAGQQRVPIEFLRQTEIPVPPLDEQHRIVARIEELTRRAEEARRLRQEAMEGIANLFQIALKRFFSPQAMGDWYEYEGRQVFDIVRGQVDPRKKPYIDLPHVAPNSIESGTGRLLKSLVKTPRDLRLRSGKYHFDSSHVLYSKIRPNLRKVVLPDFEGTCSADMYPLIPNTEVVSREFLALSLLAPPFTQYAVENSDRNAMPKINRPTMFGYRMKLPSIEVQRQIVAKTNQIQTKANEIAGLQNEAASDMEQFQPALLAKAFRGEL